MNKVAPNPFNQAGHLVVLHRPRGGSPSLGKHRGEPASMGRPRGLSPIDTVPGSEPEGNQQGTGWEPREPPYPAQSPETCPTNQKRGGGGSNP